jgi:tungstate transport system substrate-binding protein
MTAFTAFSPARPPLRARARAIGLAAQEAGFITVASTTSTEQSGLFGHILPMFQAETGIEVRVVAQGTGQALETGRRGDADVVFVHARALEERFVAEGYGVERFDVMYNDFVLVGPGDDPAGIAGAGSAADALAAIAEANAPFASRGDDSGTHVAEMNLWQAAGVAPGGRLVPRDRLRHGADAEHREPDERLCADRPRHLAVLREPRRARDPPRGRRGLFNPYGVILVSPERHPTSRPRRARPSSTG